MHTLISMLGLHYFDLREFLMMAPRCRYMQQFDTCPNCILLSDLLVDVLTIRISTI
jgi:hypothetical protein